MASNSLGINLRLTTFGESHGEAIGGILDGFPAGFSIDIDEIHREMVRRKPGQSNITTQRKETDIPRFLSGLKNNISTGMPIAWTIQNSNAKKNDYAHIESTFRPSHADFTYQQKYGLRHVEGGGRSSARETANWVVAGAICKQYLKSQNIDIVAFVYSIGTIQMPNDIVPDVKVIEQNKVRTAHLPTAKKMEAFLQNIKKQGNTIGGQIKGEIKGVPIGLGEPIFEKLNANLAKAFFSLNAVKGVEFGSGFEGTKMLGSQHNDAFVKNNAKIETITNNSGGIQGGISNGMPITFNIGFKPIATLMQTQTSVDVDGNITEIKGKGRHDPCVLPRAVPIVEALAALVITDHLLMKRLNTL